MTPISSSDATQSGAVTEHAVQEVVLEAMRLANLAREDSAQLEVSAAAPIFGPDSALDSLGLVALLLDIEDGLRGIGCEVVLSDERAMSQKRSPFRSVPALVGYITLVARG
jgi:acyl carrier protein